MAGFSVKARHRAREFILQALYQWQLSGNSVADITEHFAALPESNKADMGYFSEILPAVIANVAELDELITPLLDRPLQRLNPVELSALRLATYELVHRADIPYRVVINEALELTKKFGSTEGHKFVNGVLDKLARRVRDKDVKL